MCTPASSWFTVFTSEPMPGASPSRNTLAEVAARMLSAVANALGEPDAMNVSSPDSARARPPDIGASSRSWPPLARRSLTERANVAGTVAQCMTRPRLRKADAAPLSPNSTVSTCLSLTTATTTTSAVFAAAAGESASVPPAALKASRAAALGSTPTTLWPCLSRFFAMPSPIEPRPTKATLGVFWSVMRSGLDAVLLRPAETGGRRRLGLVLEPDIALVAEAIEDIEQVEMVGLADVGLVAVGVAGDLHVRGEREQPLGALLQIALGHLQVIEVELQLEMRRADFLDDRLDLRRGVGEVAGNVAVVDRLQHQGE